MHAYMHTYICTYVCVHVSYRHAHRVTLTTILITTLPRVLEATGCVSEVPATHTHSKAAGSFSQNPKTKPEQFRVCRA